MRFAIVATLLCDVASTSTPMYIITADGEQCEDYPGYERIVDLILCQIAASDVNPSGDHTLDTDAGGVGAGAPYSLPFGCVYDAGDNLRLTARCTTCTPPLSQPIKYSTVPQICKRSAWIDDICVNVASFVGMYETPDCDGLTVATVDNANAGSTDSMPCNSYYKLRDDGSYSFDLENKLVSDIIVIVLLG